ncbi:MAG: carbon storage regulator, partial [Planctomycetes bacterium]|nr:carbon storage regulator [Planctomycetota bacterium]
MLVLSRKLGERIVIGDQISISVVRIAPGTVRIGIEAPEDIRIVREELTGATDADGRSAVHLKIPGAAATAAR